MDWHELEKMKVTDLREMAKDKTGLTGVSGMNKDQLVEALAQALDIPKPHKVVEGAAKTRIKQQIRELKAVRAAALENRDREALLKARKQIHVLRRKLRAQARLVR